VAVARDAAFAFIYPANLQTLERLGARLAFFSPLAGDGLPACDAVWLPGGYPELHTEAIAANRALQADLRAHVLADKPIWAECGGMMALAESIA
ncbi:MAG: cobyrinic acid a,c-diamide synthase, partial [Proteobacteria bacterium]|nr:cobyrinic acid a,c-diamide synthase [Pseudomonadota bacterium]